MTDIFDKIQFHAVITQGASQDVQDMFSCLIPELTISDDEGVSHPIVRSDESIMFARTPIDFGLNSSDSDMSVGDSASVMTTDSRSRFKNLLGNLGLAKISRTNSSRSKVIPVSVGSSDYFVTVPTIKEAKRDRKYTIALKNRCIQELQILSKIVSDKELTLTTINTRLATLLAELNLDHSNDTVSTVTRLKCEVVALSAMIRQLHRDFSDKVITTPNHISLEDGDIIHIRKVVDTTIPSWRCRPALTPLQQDSHPSLRSFKQLQNLVAFCFANNGNSLQAKTDLLLSVDNETATQILLDPILFLVDSIRYLQLTIPELYNLFFQSKMDGITNSSVKCPCGIQNINVGNRLEPHLVRCEFKDFVTTYIPSLLNSEGTYGTPDREALSYQETKYIRKILEYRLPTFEWKTQPNGSKIYVRHENGQQDRVLMNEPLSIRSQHSESCSARSSRWKCQDRDRKKS